MLKRQYAMPVAPHSQFCLAENNLDSGFRRNDPILALARA